MQADLNKTLFTRTFENAFVQRAQHFGEQCYDVHLHDPIPHREQASGTQPLIQRTSPFRRPFAAKLEFSHLQCAAFVHLGAACLQQPSNRIDGVPLLTYDLPHVIGVEFHFKNREAFLSSVSICIASGFSTKPLMTNSTYFCMTRQLGEPCWRAP